MADTFLAAEFAYPSLEEALERLQIILLERVEGKPSQEQETEYRRLRRALMAEPEIKERLPRLVTVNTDLGGVWSLLKAESDSWEPRRMFVRDQMSAALRYVRELGTVGPRQATSSAWTGIQSPSERLRVAKKLIPLAQVTVEGLIAELERPQGNGGPPLEHRQDAIDNLKALHDILGTMIREMERSSAPKLSQRLVDEAGGYLARAAKALRHDPMPYLVSAGLLGLFASLGAGTLGGYVAGIASAIRKNTST